MKSLKWLLVLSLLCLSFVNVASPIASAAGDLSDELIVHWDSDVIVHNGVTYKSPQPVTVVNGTTFIPFKAIAQQYDYEVYYLPDSKESVATGTTHELRFKIGSTIMYADGQPVKVAVAPFVQEGSLMVPLRAWSDLSGSSLELEGDKVTLSWNKVQKPTANFEVQPSEIYAGETRVTYIDHSTNPSGQPFANERWEGQMDVFPEPGIYTITRQVQDVYNQWSDPYSVTIEVKRPNQPPVADFTTDKQQYRIGEKVNFIDLSTDDENAIVRTTWNGRKVDDEEDVFFAPGDYPVTLEVEDNHGAVNSVTKIISVTNDVLYNRGDYDMLFKPAGKRISIDNADVTGFDTVPYTIQSEGSSMVRVNSPEILLGEGIEYEAQITGQVRFMFHNVNNVGYPIKIYLLATNNNSTTTTVSTGAVGVGGPHPVVLNSGKAATLRYMNALASSPTPTTTTIRPHETVKLLPQVSNVPLKQGETFTAYADLNSSAELDYQVVIVASNKDPIASLPWMSILQRNDVHVRGTFSHANRAIEMDTTLGDHPQRIVLGDDKNDRYIDGIDETSGQLELNRGNFGVLYKLRLHHVAPNTLISLNPRGGVYTGAFMVNGQVVQATDDGALYTGNEAGILYRTGSSEEAVELVFTIAAGSNLPICLLFTPLPEKRS